MDYYIGGADVITRVLIRERGRQGCQTEGEEVRGWRGRWRKEATNQGRHVAPSSGKGPGSGPPSTLLGERQPC